MNDGEDFGQISDLRISEGNSDRFDIIGVVFGATMWHGYGRDFSVSENAGGEFWQVLV